MLTHRQRDALRAIDDHIADTGRTPTFRELAARLRIVSNSSIHRLVKGLAERGFIRSRPYGPIERTHIYKFNADTKALERWG